MAKLLVFVFIIVFVQNSYGYSPRNDKINKLEEEIKEYRQMIKHIELSQRTQETQNTSKFSTRSVLDFIKELKEKIENIIHLASELPSSIVDLPNKIQEIISHIHLSTVLSQIKSEVADIIDTAGPVGEKCRPFADEQTNALVESSEGASQLCINTTRGEVDQLQNSILSLAEEGKQLLSDINNQTATCFLEHKFNPAEFYKCLQEHVDEYKQKISDLQEKVTKTYENVKQQADDILKSLAICLNGVQMNTINEGQQVINDVETCVKHTEALYKINV